MGAALVSSAGLFCMRGVRRHKVFIAPDSAASSSSSLLLHKAVVSATRGWYTPPPLCFVRALKSQCLVARELSEQSAFVALSPWKLMLSFESSLALR